MPRPCKLRPYLLDEWPKSDGRTFLAHAFAFYCSLEWGFAFAEIDAAFDPNASCEASVRSQVIGSAAILGRVFQQGRVETYARPFGGGSPRLLPQSIWELDDFKGRFAQSALDPATPYDPSAAPSHWIFVDTRQFDDMMGLIDGGAAAAVHLSTLRKRSDASAPTESQATRSDDRFLKKADVLALVPFSRSTLDDRIRKGLFPKGRDLGGGILVWWESEVRDWMDRHGQEPVGD